MKQRKISTVILTSGLLLMAGWTSQPLGVQAATTAPTNAQVSKRNPVAPLSSNRDIYGEIMVNNSSYYVGQATSWSPIDNFEYAFDEEGNELGPDDLTVTGTVDLNTPGVYYVTYSYGDLEAVAKITIEENTSTLIVANQTITAGDQWNPADAIVEAHDFNGNDISLDKIYVFGNYDVNTPGVYQLTYQGDYRTTTATLTVLAKEEPAPEQPAPEQPAPEQPTPEQPAPEQPTPEQPTPEQPAPEQPAPEQPAPEQPAPEQPTPEEPAPEQPAPEQPAPEQPAPGQPMPEQTNPLPVPVLPGNAGSNQPPAPVVSTTVGVKQPEKMPNNVLTAQSVVNPETKLATTLPQTGRRAERGILILGVGLLIFSLGHLALIWRHRQMSK